LVFDTTVDDMSGRFVREFIPSLSDFQVVSNEVVDVRFSYDGRLLAAASSFASIAVWEARDAWSWSGASLRTVFRMPDDTTIKAMEASPFAPLVAAACSDGKVRFWDPSGRGDHLRIPLRHFLYQTGPASDTLAPLQASCMTNATRVVFDAENRTIFVAGADGSIQQFERQAGSLIKVNPKDLDELETHGHNGRTRELVLCPGGPRILTLGEMEVLSFTAEDWEPSPKAELRDNLLCSATTRSPARSCPSSDGGS
jgi:WD40 repeat protein